MRINRFGIDIDTAAAIVCIDIELYIALGCHLHIPVVTYYKNLCLVDCNRLFF